MPELSSSGALATVAVVALVVVAPLVGVVSFSGVSSAQEASAYAVAQGATCTGVNPVTDTNQTVTDFYDYRNPDDNENASTYSSYGTTEYQDSGGSVLFFYEGSEGASAVFVHDQLDGESEGSTLTMEFDGLSGGEWVVEDDDYDGRDDEWELEEDSATVHWKWGGGRTDGGAFRGLDDLDGPMVVDPAFNEDATYWGDWGRSGSEANLLDAWTLKGANGSETELDRDRRVFLHNGSCIPAETTASVDAPGEAETGENVTVDASDTTAEEGVGGYEWDVDEDGETDAVTTDPVIEQSFEDAGSHTVSVTAFDTYGNADTASATVDVSAPQTPPEAALDAPETVDVDETVALNATNSTDEGSITEYQWDFDGDGQIDRNTTSPTVDHQYGEVDDVTVSVTVVDDTNATDMATAKVSVLSPNERPNASLDAPESVPEGEDATLDASGSTDDRGIESYRWDYDGDGDIDGETDNATVESTYSDPGTVTATVTVVDTDGATNETSVEIEVEEVDDPPTADLEAPETVVVNESVTLDATNSSDDNGIETYRWDVDGDGEIDENTSSPTIEHPYTESGEFDPEVTVIDTGGNESSDSASIEVLEPDSPPDASLSAPANATVDDEIEFDASDSTDDDDIETYRWDFDGDGEVDEETDDAEVTHEYDTADTYDASVTVVDSAGQEATATTTVSITGPPEALFEMTTDDPTAGDEISFDASASTPGFDLVQYEWEFGDGETATGETVSHTYDDEGTYNVTLEVETAIGATATMNTSIEVAARSSGGGGGSGGGGSGGGGSSGGGSGGGGSDGGGSSGGSDGGGASDPVDGEPSIGPANVTLDRQTLLVGDSVVVDATVSNTGDGPGTKTVEFEVEGSMLEEREIPLDPGETRTVTFTHEFTTPGEKVIQVDHGEKRYVTVEPREPDVSVRSVDGVDQPVAAGDAFTLTAVVANTGHAIGSETVELELFDEVVAVENVSVAAGETERVEFTRSIRAPGTYDALVGNASVTIQVDGRENSTTTPAGNDSSGGTIPGFGVAVTVLALAAVLFAVARANE